MRTGIVIALLALVLLSPSPRADAATGEIHIVNGTPNPAELTIQEGDTVVFFNDDDVAHAIFAGGQQRGHSIAPHSASDTYGPFDAGGQGGRAEYQIDADGATGVILIAAPTTSTTAPSTTTTTAPPATTAATVPVTTTTAPTTTTSTSTSTTTTSTTTTTTVRSSSSSSAGGRGQDSPSKTWLAVIGGILVLIGLGNMVRVMVRPKHRRRPQA